MDLFDTGKLKCRVGRIGILDSLEGCISCEQEKRNKKV